jgi:AcrR family transcriptional regulator
MLQAAARVFARHGLKASRMADIAREMGVAHGSLYNYVESKEALFLLLVDQWGHQAIDLAGQELPLKTPPMQSLVKRRRPADPQSELHAIVRELFVLTERSREGATILEKSARDVPELFGLFFEQVRRDLFERMTRYVAMRVQEGSFAAADPATAARFIIESVTFFARHRFLDPHPQPLDDDAVRHTVVDLVTRSLISQQRRPPTRPRKRTK